MINLSKEISNLSNNLSKSLKSETDKIGKSIEESNIVAITKVNKEVNKIIDSAKKNNNAKLLKELSNSTSSLNAALEAISSQNRLLVKEIRDKKESITFP
jgi:molecular chaperone GrpE (heat shock protein)